VWWNVLRPQPSPTAGTAAPRPAAGAPARAQPGTQETGAVENVALDALERPRPGPAEGERNLFRFGERQRPAPSGPGGAATHDTPPALPGVEPGEPLAGPSGPPPIALRFVGLVERTRAKRKIAILTDGRNTFYGAEGDIIEGRYRIVQIGTESVELSYLDGSGRQRLRLAGS
jgi:hypothetical protein